MTDLTGLAPGEGRANHAWWRPVAVALVALAILLLGTGTVLARLGRPLQAEPLVVTPPQPGAQDTVPRLTSRGARAGRLLDQVRPRGVYLVVDTFQNRLYVYRDGELLRSAICSTGTGVVLRDPRTGRTWVFDTPLGERTIERKVRNPVWAKPDWAFIEEGYLPPKDPNERFDPYSLGDYGLYMGDGYIIHGTIFKSLLGRRVTHGCIRLGDDDLEFVYRHARLGTKVYMY